MAKIREEIEATNAQFLAAFGRGDAAAVAACYTEHGQILPPNADTTVGRQAIQAFWQATFDAGIKAAKLETLEAEAHGDTAIEVGRYVLYGGGGQQLDVGKFVVVWKREGGEWRLHRDIFNSSLPAPGT
jgi:uncharacterized protein (TIGR02246 family)